MNIYGLKVSWTFCKSCEIVFSFKRKKNWITCISNLFEVFKFYKHKFYGVKYVVKLLKWRWNFYFSQIAEWYKSSTYIWCRLPCLLIICLFTRCDRKLSNLFTVLVSLVLLQCTSWKILSQCLCANVIFIWRSVLKSLFHDFFVWFFSLC